MVTRGQEVFVLVGRAFPALFLDKGNFVSISQRRAWVSLCIGGFGDNALDTRSFVGTGDLLREFHSILSACMLKYEDEGASCRQRASKARGNAVS